MLFFLFVVGFVGFACVLVPLACLGLGALLRPGRRPESKG